METSRTDVVVIGGGIAGISAAIAIAQSKKKVILIDRLPVIGGASVNSNVGTVCGAFYRSFTSRKIAGHSFSDFFIDLLLKTPGITKPYVHQDGLYIIPYEWTALRSIYLKLLAEYGVEFRLNATLDKVKIENKRITELIIDKSNVITDSVVDCSGNAIVSQLGGLETIKDNSYQAASQIFRLAQVNNANEYSLNFALKRAILKNESEKKWPASYRSLSVVQDSIRNDLVDLKLTMPEIITDQTNLDELKKSATDRIADLIPVLKKEIESLVNASLETIFPLPGYRVMQRSKGKHILTESDVLTCKKPDQGIAIGTWPIEEWGYDGNLSMEFFAPDDGYYIPAGCLVSAQIENLFFGGRNISATSKAIASARVMGTAWQTGYAAGKLSCAGNDSEIQQVIEELHRELK